MRSTATADTYTYDILVEVRPDGMYQASVLGWAECQAVAATSEAAIVAVKDRVSDRLAKAQIIRVKVEVPSPEHPWLKFAGMFKDEPMFDEVLAAIQQYREELDADLAEPNLPIEASQTKLDGAA
ncbi:MAG: hypothetical protein MUF49_23340 [Oculatellaceae cyanobacterium Prado106]|jgi:hypothetical protein|nr:hypothetical protein [Oculatellaceae cyanobacterium Prado106]